MANAASLVRESALRVAAPRPYVLLVGHGSSGTKRMFNLLHQSRETHCRWGPHSLRDSAFKGLPSEHAFVAADEDVMDARWDAAITWISERFSLEEKDGLPVPPKRYLRPTMRRLFMSVVTPKRMRSILTRVVPMLRQPDWRLPDWLGDLRQLKQAILAVRMGQVPAWTAWVLRNRPEATVVHVARHPAAYLHAWWGRFGRHQDQAVLTRQNRDRLRKVADVHPEWSDRFGDIDRLTSVEAELWFWSYSTLTTHEAGEGRERYDLVRDEEVVEDPVAVARRTYARCGLEWTPEIEELVARKAVNWQRRTAVARDLLDDELSYLVERVLRGTVMHGWWSMDQTVSLFDYHF